jgi:cysteine desulfurase
VLQSALATQPGKRHILTTRSNIRPSSNIANGCKNRACEVTFLPVDADGMLDLHLLDQSIRPDTAVVSVMWANNETGVVFPVEEIAAICRSRGVLFHTDATQVPGKLKMDVGEVGADFLTLSAHKLHAPKGVGLLYVRRKTKFQPYLIGGHQERGKRGGTENVAGIVGFGRAAELAMERLGGREHARAGVARPAGKYDFAHVPNTVRNGAKEPRLPNTSNIAFDFVEAEGILMKLDELGICVSSGSACTTGSLESVPRPDRHGHQARAGQGLRALQPGIYNTDEEVDYLLKHIPQVIARLREASPEKPARPRQTHQPAWRRALIHLQNFE